METSQKKYDPAMAYTATPLPPARWSNCDEAPFELEGFAFRKPGEPLRRLPESRPDREFSEAVDVYADHAAGGVLRFRSDTPFIAVRATVTCHNNSADIMSAGRSGFDLYMDGAFIAVTRKNYDELSFPTHSFAAVLTPPPEPERKMHEFELYFPLYARVDFFEIGVAPEARVELPRPRRNPHPVVFYGTSIIHGCCASRPGLAETAQLARLLDRPVLNFGFAGSAKGEPEVAETIAEVKTPALFLLDYDANVDLDRLEQTLPRFTDILRERHPAVPIVTISQLRIPAEREANSADRLRRSAIHRANCERRRAMGDEAVYFLDGFDLLGETFAECFVDAVHPNDVGFLRVSEKLAAFLCEIRLA